MKPIRTIRNTFTYRGNPAEDVKDLPCRVEDGVVYSTWTLDHAERLAIAEGANIELAVTGRMPPVSLIIDPEPIELPAQDRHAR